MGQGEQVQELPVAVTTVSQLRNWLEAEHQQLSGLLTGVRFAVNEQFVSDDHELHENDAVALIPPVSGG